MTFLLGLEQLTRDEKIMLLSQIEVINTTNLFNDTIQKYSKKGKEIILSTTSSLTGRFSLEFGKIFDDLNQKTNWNPEVLQKKINESYKKYCVKCDDCLNDLLLRKIKIISEVNDDVNNDIYANGIVHRAATSLNVNYRLYLDSTSLEAAVFEECIKEQIEMIKNNIRKMNKEELNIIEELLTEELNKLSSAQHDSIKKTLKLENISGQALINFVKTISTTTFVQMVLSGFGFGFFLFLTTIMKAFSLLLGVTFSFGTYTVLTSTFGFVLSLPFLLISTLISGGIITKFTNSKIDNEIAKLLIVIGRTKLLS